MTGEGPRTAGAVPSPPSGQKQAALAVLAAVPPACLAAGLVRGWTGAWTAALALAVVIGFFGVSRLVVDAVQRLDARLLMPAVLVSYAVKLLLLGFALLGSTRGDGLDRGVFAGTVIGGGLLWIAVQATAWVRTSRPAA